MLNVVQMLGAAKPGGAEMFFYRFVVALHNHPDVKVLAIVRKGSWMEGMLEAAKVPYEAVPFGGMFDFKTGPMVRRIVGTFGAHVVQSWMNRATRFVPKGPWVRIGRLGGLYDLKYYRGKVDNLIGNTEEICDYCRAHGWPAEKVAMISNFIPKPEEGWKYARAAKRRELGFEDGDKVAMIAGRLHKVKGVDIAIRALAELPENFKLMLVGEGPLRGELEALAKELAVDGRIVWTGWQDSVTPFAAAADMWLAPSRHEPLGNTVLDGWVHEVPVIATNTGGLAMLVGGENDGVTGISVPVDDVVALRDAMVRLAGDAGLASNLVNGALARFEKEFGEAVIVGQYVTYYNKVARGHRDG